MADGKGLVDVLGVAPIAKTVETTMAGISAFLGKICMPAAEQFGLLLREKVQGWRQLNAIRIVERTRDAMAKMSVPDGVKADPRVVHKIVEEGSWVDDSAVQDMWAGLLASSCTETGDDDSNLLFVNLLSQLTKLQAKIVRLACERAGKYQSGGLILSYQFALTTDEFAQLVGEPDIQRLDRECDDLLSRGLLARGVGGFQSHNANVVNLTPTPLALHMYVRCQGSRQSPIEFFDAKQVDIGEKYRSPLRVASKPLDVDIPSESN